MFVSSFVYLRVWVWWNVHRTESTARAGESEREAEPRHDGGLSSVPTSAG